jgi:hypothetical protein
MTGALVDEIHQLLHLPLVDGVGVLHHAPHR